MARKALLIGTSQYLDGFKPLKSATHDVSSLAKLLNNPEIGRFDEVQVETDLEASILAEKIETWYLGHGKDDFVLLFLVGHGVKDADRKLHFAATNTKKVGDKLITTTAIAASDVSRWMGGSKAKRQIVILNCCFSGAFGDLVPMDEGAIDVDEAIWAEGRVVMTSTSSMNYAFERLIGGELSVYGHYLEEGLRTGAAAATDSDEITIDRLHRYVSRKVQEEVPSMVPKIFAKGEGYQLRIAKVALGDPLVQYRKRVEEIVQEDGDEICEVFSRPILEELLSKLGISDDDAIEVEKSVLEPIIQYRSKLIRYQEVVKKAIHHKYPFGDREKKRLIEFQNSLGISDGDADRFLSGEIGKLIDSETDNPAAEILLIEGTLLEQTNEFKLCIQAEDTSPMIIQNNYYQTIEQRQEEVPDQIDKIPLNSLKGLDYLKLRDLLKEKKWEEADKETLRLMLLILNCESEGWLDMGQSGYIPCQDLCTIDNLWVISSNGHFGFSVQRNIWDGCGSPFIRPDDLKEFRSKVGWGHEGYLLPLNLKFSELRSPVGELPIYWLKNWRSKDLSHRCYRLFSRLESCAL